MPLYHSKLQHEKPATTCYLPLGPEFSLGAQIATIANQICTTAIIGRWTRQEEYCVRYLARHSVPSARRRSTEMGCDLVVRPVQQKFQLLAHMRQLKHSQKACRHRRGNQPWRDGVDVDAISRIVNCGLFGQANDTKFRSAVGLSSCN